MFEDPKPTVAAYLRQWLTVQEERLMPNTYAGYADWAQRYLIPVFGKVKLRDLRSRHIEAWGTEQLAAGLSPGTLYRITATLRTALNAAVRSHQIAYNPAQYALIPRPKARERLCWSPEQAAFFLRHNSEYYADQLSDLFEVVLGTGLRRGEVLALHWTDIHLMDRCLFVRWNLSAVNNNQLHLGPPKTADGRDWVALSPRAITALRRQAEIHQAAQPAGTPLAGLVFARTEGTPLRPQWVLDQLRRRTTETGLPTITLHDLRHTAATIMISRNIPLAIVSKTMRHANLATTVDLYGHLLKTRRPGRRPRPLPSPRRRRHQPHPRPPRCRPALRRIGGSAGQRFARARTRELLRV